MSRSRRYRMEAEELAAAEAEGPDRVPPTPRPAAGVILARDRGGGPEILLVRRRSDVGFAAGAHVFPGGTLDEGDSDPGWSRWLELPSEEALAGAADAEGPEAAAFVVAALRETFEEVGILLAERLEPIPDAARRDLIEGRRSFLEIVSSRGLRLAGDRLVLCARWITPEALSRRYDARFFLVQAPSGVEVTPDPNELVEHVWIRPAEALDLYFDHQFPMLFPTAKTLGWLTEAGGTVADWLERFRRTQAEPILPRLRRFDGEVVPVMPGEESYDERQGDG